MTAAHPQLPNPDYSVLPPRRAKVVLDEPQIRALLGLADDEHIQAVQWHQDYGHLAITVDSPRLPPVGVDMGNGHQPTWSTPPPIVNLPLADHYEAQDTKPFPSVKS